VGLAGRTREGVAAKLENAENAFQMSLNQIEELKTMIAQLAEDREARQGIYIYYLSF
jgi:hypothetical protein